MPRPRTNDPLGVSDNPVCVTDPVREAEITAELSQRFAYVEQSFRVGLLFYGGGKELNDSLRLLKVAVTSGTPEGLSGKRLPPMLEMAISRQARRFARDRVGCEDAEVEGEDIKRASREVAWTLGPVAHRPAADLLRHHVEGLMALLQEGTGKPVLTGRYRGSVYEGAVSLTATCLRPTQLSPSWQALRS